MKKLTIILLIAIGLAFPTLTFAAKAQVSVEGTNVKVGEESTITVTYSGDNIGRVSGMLEYDVSTLSYISGGSSEGDAGAVQLKRAGTGGAIEFQLKFKALKEGPTTVKISTYEAYDLDEQSMGTPETQENIRITAEKASDPPAKDPVEEPKKEEPKKTKDPKENNQDQEESGFHTIYLLIGGIILVLAIMIIALAVRKKGKREK
ncbi:MAG: cohesin domain-containing protein [Anaerovoracaceae bacterium]|jgi:hypothetical protein